jgi:hypothetical protein
MGLYILEGKTFRRARSLDEWGEFMSLEGKVPLYRHVGRDYFYIGGVGYCNLSTVFLGLDHGFPVIGNEHSNPVLFESLIFGGDSLNDSMKRYTSWGDAEQGHIRIYHRICKVIKTRFKIINATFETEGKRNDIYFYPLVEGYVKFTGDDMRLIRES